MVTDEQLPQYVFRMRTVNRYLFDSLINGEMWFSNPSDFNDPFDCDINMQIQNSSQEKIQNYFDKYLVNHFGITELKGINKNRITREEFEKFINIVAKKVAKRKGVACFMSNCENLLMWAHYADSHKGISLIYAQYIMDASNGEILALVKPSGLTKESNKIMTTNKLKKIIKSINN